MYRKREKRDLQKQIKNLKLDYANHNISQDQYYQDLNELEKHYEQILISESKRKEYPEGYIDQNCIIKEKTNQLEIDFIYNIAAKGFLSLIEFSLLISLPLGFFSILLGITSIISFLFFLLMLLVFESPLFFYYIYDKFKLKKIIINKRTGTIVYYKSVFGIKDIKKILITDIKQIACYKESIHGWGSNYWHHLSLFLDDVNEIKVYFGREDNCKKLAVKVAKFLEKPLYYGKGRFKESILY